MIIKVLVKPNSKESKIISRDPWIISVKSPPKNNKANLELIKLFKPKKVRIISGHSSRRKIIDLGD